MSEKGFSLINFDGASDVIIKLLDMIKEQIISGNIGDNFIMI